MNVPRFDLFGYQFPTEYDAVEGVEYFFVALHGDGDFVLFWWHCGFEPLRVGGGVGFEVEFCGVEEFVVGEGFELVDDEG